MKLRSLLLLCIGLGACGAQMGAAPPTAAGGSEEAESADQPAHLGGTAWDELTTNDDALRNELELASTNCRAAHELTVSICELAERVCTTAEQARSDEGIERCEDGRARCASARERTDARCP